HQKSGDDEISGPVHHKSRAYPFYTKPVGGKFLAKSGQRVGLWGRFLDRFLTAKAPQPRGAGRAQKKSAGGPLVAQAFRPASRPLGSPEGMRYQRFLRKPKRGSDHRLCHLLFI